MYPAFRLRQFALLQEKGQKNQGLFDRAHECPNAARGQGNRFPVFLRLKNFDCEINKLEHHKHANQDRNNKYFRYQYNTKPLHTVQVSGDGST
jgi:hypothetical protein